jgi:tripeptide aminopeptidase
MDIQRWQADPVIKQAFAQIADYKPMLATAIAVQQVAAPTFDEAKRGELVHQRFVGLGLSDVTTDQLGNVYACRPGRATRPAVMVAAHLDTVFPHDTNLTIRHEGERIYGPGIGDNSTGVAGLLHLAQAMQEFDLPNAGDCWFVANVGEEGLGDLRGMRAAVERLRSKLGAVIVLEGCDFGTLHHQAIGVRRYKIEVSTAGGHSWGNFGSPSAIHILVRLAARLTEISLPQSPRTTYNIGVIEGGTSVNTIAQHASLLLDMRSASPYALSNLVSQVDDKIRRLAAEHTDAKVTVNMVGNRPSGSIPRDHPLVQAATAAYQLVGATVNYQQSSTDANIPLSLDIPAVCMGLTDGGNAHRSDEFINPANLGRGLQALLLLTMAACEGV